METIYRVLMGMGERGLLNKIQAVLVGRSRSLESGEIVDLAKIENWLLVKDTTILSFTTLSF